MIWLSNTYMAYNLKLFWIYYYDYRTCRLARLMPTTSSSQPQYKHGARREPRATKLAPAELRAPRGWPRTRRGVGCAYAGGRRRLALPWPVARATTPPPRERARRGEVRRMNTWTARSRLPSQTNRAPPHHATPPPFQFDSPSKRGTKKPSNPQHHRIEKRDVLGDPYRER